jgi:hypothetical protein
MRERSVVVLQAHDVWGGFAAREEEGGMGGGGGDGRKEEGKKGTLLLCRPITPHWFPLVSLVVESD